MIKYILLGVFLWVSFSSTYGQYRRDAWTVSPKLSFADYSDQKNWEDYSISKVPPISVFAEKGLTDFLSAGGFLGYKGDKYVNDTIQDTQLRYRSYLTGVVGTIHYAHWIERLSGHSIFLGDFDFYVSGAMQLAVSATNEQHVWSSEKEDFQNNKESEVKFRIRPIFGIRYFLTDYFCMAFEVGEGNAGMITTGVTWFLDR